MREILDERVRLPKLFTHILVAVFGISGLLMLYGIEEPSYWSTIMILIASFCAGCFTFGLVSILAILKRGKGLKGVIKVFNDNFKITFYDDNRNPK